jgi:hypothetical protein
MPWTFLDTSYVEAKIRRDLDVPVRRAQGDLRGPDNCAGDAGGEYPVADLDLR